MRPDASPADNAPWRARGLVLLLGICLWLVLVGIPSVGTEYPSWLLLASALSVVGLLIGGAASLPKRTTPSGVLLLALVPATIALSCIPLPHDAMTDLWVWLGGATAFALYLSCGAWVIRGSQDTVITQTRRLERTELGREPPRPHHAQRLFRLGAMASAGAMAILLPASLNPALLEAKWGDSYMAVWSFVAILGFCLACLWLIGLIAPATRKSKEQSRSLRTRIIRSTAFLFAALIAIFLQTAR